MAKREDFLDFTKVIGYKYHLLCHPPSGDHSKYPTSKSMKCRNPHPKGDKVLTVQTKLCCPKFQTRSSFDVMLTHEKIGMWSFLDFGAFSILEFGSATWVCIIVSMVTYYLKPAGSPVLHFCHSSVSLCPPSPAPTHRTGELGFLYARLSDGK